MATRGTTGYAGGRLVVLDSWRGLCALIVAIFHFTVASHLFDTYLVRSAWMFVDFFFVLSGFVIHLAYADRLATWSDAGRFVLRRFGRVWPLHMAMLLLLLGWETLKAVMTAKGLFHPDRPPFAGETSPVALLANVGLLHAMGLFPTTTWNDPSWSISVEFYTYLLFALLVLALRRWMIVAAIVLVPACLLFLLLVPPLHLHVMTDYGFIRCVAGFMLGALVAAAHARGRLAGAGGTIAEVGALAACALVLRTGSSAWNVLAPLVFAGAMAVFAQEGGLVSRLLSRRPFRLLGDLSYAIYMVHTALLAIVFDRVARMLAARIGGGAVPYHEASGTTFPLMTFPSQWTGDALLLVYVAVVVVVAWVAHRTVEVPARDWFNRLAKGRPRHHPELAPAPEIIPAAATRVPG